MRRMKRWRRSSWLAEGAADSARRNSSCQQAMGPQTEAVGLPTVASALSKRSEGWRRGRDSNPRAGYPARRFRGAPVTTTSVPLRLLRSLLRSLSRNDLTVLRLRPFSSGALEELLHHRAAFVFEHTAGRLETVIQRRVLVRPHGRLDRARLRLGRAVDHRARCARGPSPRRTSGTARSSHTAWRRVSR